MTETESTYASVQKFLKQAAEVLGRHQSATEARGKQLEDLARHKLGNLKQRLTQRLGAAGPYSGLDWQDPSWERYRLVGDQIEGPRLTRIGQVGFECADVIAIPAMVPILGRGNLFIRAEGNALRAAQSALQSAVFRLLVETKPGGLRLTLVDSVELGQSFASLLRLPQPIRGEAVWHAPQDIRARIKDLVDHIAMVRQRYVTDQFQDIDAYNRKVGELAEPYRLLVVANFPAGFSSADAESLMSIARSGPLMGVYVLMTIDGKRELPRGLVEADLYRTGYLINGEREQWRFVGTRTVLDQGVLWLDASPPAEVSKRILQQFSTIRPNPPREPPDFWPPKIWTESSGDGLVVPIGKKGADVQNLELGAGGSMTHHVLLGGLPGSGKSSLLHTLILSATSRYSPDELELYLIDFREGVEFEVYRKLPHARVVAIQSEPEFGVSVLKGVRKVFKERGELFRRAGCNQISEYRRKYSCPRIMVIIDEFQALFDGPWSSEASVLLDQLVRLGRGFGTHVILSTQTLPERGLGEATYGQISVRIALRLSEAGSYQILGRDNDEAQGLERAGQAIYNPKGGARGSNFKFQVAFVEDNARAARVEKLVDPKGRLPLVFEGNKPGYIGSNSQLVAARGQRPSRVPPSIPLFLGEPLELMAAHPAFPLRRQNGSHLMICGANEKMSLGVTASACISAAFQLPHQAAVLHVLDLSNVNSSEHGRLRSLTHLPQKVHYGVRRHTVKVLQLFSEEFERRAAAADLDLDISQSNPPWILTLFGLQGAREFQPRSTELKILERLLHDGADLGLHVIFWVSSFTRLQGILEPRSWRELDGWVIVEGGESEKLLPQELKLNLKANYAYFKYNCEDGALLKFRGYGESWIDWLGGEKNV